MSKKYCQKNITYFVKMKSNKTWSTSLKTCFLRCKKHTNNRLSTNHVTNNKVARNSSHCAECWSEIYETKKIKSKRL